MPFNGTLEERLWAKVRKAGPDECWVWDGGLNSSGRGVIARGGGRPTRKVLASVAVWELTFGAVPAGGYVRQSCENVLCVNPRHLSVAMGRRTPLADRLWRRVKKGPSCWEWIGAVDKDGYGSMNIHVVGGGKTSLRTHRVSWELSNGRPVPPGLMVCHSCDNPPCVNPAHLFLGTAAENTADSRKKGRRAEITRRTLTDSDVVRIRILYNWGLSQDSIAPQFSVSQHTISRVVRKKAFPNVTGLAEADCCL